MIGSKINVVCSLCGKIRHVLKHGAGQYCKSCRNRISNLTKRNLIKDKQGQQYNSLIVVGFSHKQNGRVYWLCKCICGKHITIDGTKLNHKNGQKSCGCLYRKRGGKTMTRSYKSWETMMRRCYNPRSNRYRNYGGRGIGVCKKWHDFNGFFCDMGERPVTHQLDRIDVNGDYCPENCRWTNSKLQARNKTNNHLITAFNKTKILAEWAREFKIASSALSWRIKAGWNTEDAISLPVNWKKREDK